MPIIHSVSVTEEEENLLKERRWSPTKVFKVGIQTLSAELIMNMTYNEKFDAFLEKIKCLEKELAEKN